MIELVENCFVFFVAFLRRCFLQLGLAAKAEYVRLVKKLPNVSIFECKCYSIFFNHDFLHISRRKRKL